MAPRWLFGIGISITIFAADARTEAQTVPHGLRVPPGFSVTEFAGDDLAHDCYTLTINPGAGRSSPAGATSAADRRRRRRQSRLGRSKSPTVPRTGRWACSGRATRSGPSATAACAASRSGPDGKAVGPSELVYKLKTGGEHDAHAIRRGPDGWLYVLCGNDPRTSGQGRLAAAPRRSASRSPARSCAFRRT